MYKKTMSFVLAIVMLLSLSINVLANETPTGQLVSDGNIESIDTGSAILTICEGEHGNLLFAGAYKNAPHIVYQWTGSASQFYALIHSDDVFGYLETLPFTNLDNIEVVDFDSFLCGHTSTWASSRHELAAVRNDMEDRYGSKQDWYPLQTDSTSHAPLTIRVRQDVIISAEAMGLEPIPEGVPIVTTAASWAAKYAEWLTVSSALGMISAITGIVNAADWVQETMFAQMYRGVSSTQRFGTVTPANGTETTMVTASRTYCRYYCFDDSLNITSSNAADYLVDSGRFECIYAPSEYKFNVVTMMDEAYDLYMMN